MKNYWAKIKAISSVRKKIVWKKKTQGNQSIFNTKIKLKISLKQEPVCTLKINYLKKIH